ncbi:MAG: bifunctional 5,10-methylenetetrahydrofolate dehydrogenase/5,10-methenyltetrahydrofolate cyclohydrolase [Bacteriovoracaceae bacterium]
MTQLLKAKPAREKEIQVLKDQTQELVEQGLTPCLKVILVGNNPASVIYTNNKKKFVENFGGSCEIIKLAESISEKEFLEQVEKISENPDVHGCFVQLPLPEQLKHIDVGQLIPPDKDVDGFHSENITAIFKGDCGDTSLAPCTPKGIITLMHHYGVELSGKDCVVIGRSEIVGKPMSMLLTNYNATVTLTHSRTKDLRKFTKEADIIIVAIGKAKFLDESYISNDKNQVIIDVGMNQDEDGKLCGDVDFDNIVEKVASITPVPGGVGPMTILTLGQNLIKATRRTLK